MATDRVRVTAYVDPAVGALLASVADVLGQSVSQTVSETLEAAVPVLEVLLDLGRQLQEAPERHREALASLAAALAPMAEDANRMLDGLATLGDPQPLTGGSE